MAKKTKPKVDERLQQWEEFAASHSAQYALIDSDGNRLGDSTYDLIREPVNGFAIFKKDGRYGVLNRDGSVAVDAIYESVGNFDNGLAAVKVDGRWGFINEKGEEVIKPRFEDSTAPYFRENLAYVIINGKYGFIDPEGNEVIAPVFEKAYAFEGDLAAVKVDGKIGFIDKTGNMVIPPAYDSVPTGWNVRVWRDGFAIVKVANKTGLIDRKGNTVLPTVYDDVEFFATHPILTDGEENYYEISVKPQGTGIICSKGIVVEPVYEKISDYSEGLTAAKRDGKWGYLDTEGNIALPFEYDNASSFKGSYARVTKDSRTFVIDRAGNEICDKVEKLQFGCDEPLEGVCAGIKDGKYGLLDDKGQFILPCDFDGIERWGVTHLVQVSKDHKYGIYDLSGKEIIKVGFEVIYEPRSEETPVIIFSDSSENQGVVTPEGKFILNPDDFSSCDVEENAGVIVATDKNGNTGLYRYDGSLIKACVADRIQGYSDNGLAIATKDRRYGIIDREGNWVIPAEYDGIFKMSEGLAAAEKDGKWGFINDKNEWVIPATYDSAYREFKHGYTTVDKDGKYILINSKGKELTKPAATIEIGEPSEGMIPFKVGRKYGYLNTEGEVAIKPAFESAEKFEYGSALVSLKVEKQPMWTFVTKDGQTHETFENSIYHFDYLMPVEKEGKKAIFRPDGTLAVPFVLKQVSRIVDGISAIQFI